MSLDINTLFASFPSGLAQGLLWGIMALGLYITLPMLNFADMTVDGTFTTGGAVTVMLITCRPCYRLPAYKTWHSCHSFRNINAVCLMVN